MAQSLRVWNFIRKVSSMRGLIILIVLTVCLSGMPHASASGLPFGTVFKGTDKFDRLVQQAKAGRLEIAADRRTHCHRGTRPDWNAI